MTRWSGMLKILRFNWPWYAGAVLVTALVGWLLATAALAAPWWWIALGMLVLADLWLLLSLAVSHVIYDRSGVARGEWLSSASASASPSAVASAASVAVFHFGQDEASALVAQHLPAAARRTFDLYDPTRAGSPSLRRARALAAPDATVIAAALDRIPLADGSLDLGVLAFAAHEVRGEATRAALFREVARTLASSGRVVVVEHLRDAWNALAYGPGVFHFLSWRTWQRTFAAAGLTVIHQSRLTPWVTRFELERSA